MIWSHGHHHRPINLPDIRMLLHEHSDTTDEYSVSQYLIKYIFFVVARIVLCGNDSKVPFVVFRVFVWLNRELFIIIVIIIIFLSFCSFAWGLSYRLCCFGFLFDYCCLVFSPINGKTAFHFMTIISHRIRNALAL